jgi:hypothetical protein
MPIVILLAGFCALVLVMPMLGVLFGAFSGWVVGLFFSETILGFLARVGVDVDGLALWQVGAAMGFLGGFLKTSITRQKTE